MKILITGARGFVGRALSEELSIQKHAVYEFDRSKGHNILDKLSLLNAMEGIDCVVHLAAAMEGTKEEIHKTNVEGTRNVLKAAIAQKVKKLIFMSSTAVYGFTNTAVHEESDLNPENDYEKSKVEGEIIILEAKEKLDVCVVRSAMVFGANEYWKKMFKMLEKKYPLPCSGRNKFQVIYVTELARAIAAVIEKGKSGEIYLVSGKEQPTLNEFCEMIQEELGLKKGVQHIPSWAGIALGHVIGIKLLNQDNIRHISKERHYKIEKIEKLGFKQEITLKNAIKNVAKEFEKQKS
jgi:nucleoside-diphosphate-sugar epimerase